MDHRDKIEVASPLGVEYLISISWIMEKQYEIIVSGKHGLNKKDETYYVYLV